MVVILIVSPPPGPGPGDEIPPSPSPRVGSTSSTPIHVTYTRPYNGQQYLVNPRHQRYDSQGNSQQSTASSNNGISSSASNTTATSASLLSSLSSQVDPENLLSTNKEEEWVTKKKTELTTTKQIETRVKRHLVLEDGKVVDDSGPIVTTNTTEDTEKQEHQHTEHRTHGDGPPLPDEGWVAVPGPGGMVKEVKEKKVRSREEKEERTETEDIHHLGDITDEGYLAAVREKKDVRQALLSGQEVVRGQDGNLVVVDPRNSGPRLVHQSSKGRKVVDTENTHEISEIQPDGRVITEKRRTTEHEEVDEKEDPDDGELEEEDKHRESSHRFRKSKDQELVEYIADGVKIGQEMRYQCENVEGERFGDAAALDAVDQEEWDSLSTRIRRMRRNKLLQQRAAVAAGQLGPAPALDRKDALTKRPLDFDQEEETRKVETSKWLEHHFGSESRSSKDSIEDEDDIQKGTTTSFINVTMKSRPVTPKTNGFSSPTRLNGHTTSSSRVFVSSPEPRVTTPRPESPYFQGISQWSERRNGTRESTWNKKSTFSSSDPTSAVVGGHTARPDRVQVLPSGPDHTFNTSNGGTRMYKTTSTHMVGGGDRISPVSPRGSPYSDESPPHYSHNVNTVFLERERAASPSPWGRRVYRDKSPSPPHRSKKYSSPRYDEEDEVGYRSSSGIRKKESFREWDRDRREASREPSPSPSPPPMPSNKKLYQRTRFAADIPPPSRHGSVPPSAVVKTQQQSASQIIGDSFRKLVGKFRSSSSERKKEKAARKLSNKSRGSSRSPSPTYRAADGSLLGRKKSSKSGGSASSSRRGTPSGGGGSSPNEGTEEGDSPEEQPVAPPRHGGSRSVARARSQRSASRLRTSNGNDSSDRDVVDGEIGRTTRKYYLGEDPFGGSIYGREREYDGVVPARKKQREARRGSQSEEERNSSNLGRLSKSTSRLAGSGPGPGQGHAQLNGSSSRRQEYYTQGTRGGSQTLPRKLRDDSSSRTKKQQVYVTKSNVERTGSSPSQPQVWEHRFHREPRSSLTSPHTGSLINVSFVNQVTPPASSIGVSRPQNGVTWDRDSSQGPAKPARTYRTSLTRSKSFNVQAGPTTYITPAKSSSQLHRLEESPPPLKSPSILASISRSQRDLTDAVDKENVEDLYTKPRKGERLGTSHLNGVNSSHDHKKKAFMRGLLDRAPELFKTLHPEEEQPTRSPSRSPNGPGGVRVIDYSNSFRSGNTATPPPRSPFRQTPDRSSPSGNKPAVYTSKVTYTPSFRRGSGSPDSDDFSETVRITSKSTDPLRPSVTNTVQSYSKKTVPSSRGGHEVIEMSDTSTVTRSSRYRGGSGDSGVDTSSSTGPGPLPVHSRFILDADPKLSGKYSRHADRHAERHANGGVVIEVRNTRK